MTYKKRLEEAKTQAPVIARVKKAIKGSVKQPEVNNTEVAKSQVEAIQTQGEALQRVQHLNTLVKEYVNITTEEQYKEADDLLGQIAAFKKWWTPIINKPIKLIRSGLDALYELNREVTRPTEKLESVLKGSMMAYKREEQRLKQQELQELENRRLELLAQAQRRVTPQIKAKLEQQIEQVETIQGRVAEVEGVQGASSHVRGRKVIKVIDPKAFLKGILAGTVPLDAIEINHTVIRNYYRDDPETVRAWPGVTEEEELSISHGRRFTY